MVTKEIIIMDDLLMNDLCNKVNWLKKNTNHNIVFIAHQGSWNYNMGVINKSYQSDIDVKAICLPSLTDIVRGNKMVSHTYIMDDKSHIDVKDIRLYSNLWKKSNPQFLEILFSKYKLIFNETFKKIIDMADEIALANFNRLLSSIKGMQLEKQKALTHPYPSIKDKIDKYGYDPKQLHHIVRLCEFGKSIIEGESFGEAMLLKKDCHDEVMNLKIYPVPLEKAIQLANDKVDELYKIITKYRNDNNIKMDCPNENIYEKLNELIFQMVEDEILTKLSRY